MVRLRSHARCAILLNDRCWTTSGPEVRANYIGNQAPGSRRDPLRIENVDQRPGSAGQIKVKLSLLIDDKLACRISILSELRPRSRWGCLPRYVTNRSLLVYARSSSWLDRRSSSGLEITRKIQPLRSNGPYIANHSGYHHHLENAVLGNGTFRTEEEIGSTFSESVQCFVHVDKGPERSLAGKHRGPRRTVGLCR